MTKVTIEYDDSELLGCMFRDAITHCIGMKMELLVKMQKERDTATEQEKLLDIHMQKFYDEKIEAYEKMKSSMTWEKQNG